MSTPMDMQESQARNEFGYIGCPSVNAAPGAAVHSHVDQSSNKALPWVAFSWLLSGGAMLGLIIWSLVAPSLIDSRVEARVARAEALAELARKEASTAKDTVDLEVQRRKAREEFKR